MMMTMMMCRKGEYKDLDNDHKDDDDKIIKREYKDDDIDHEEGVDYHHLKRVFVIRCRASH